VKRDLEVASSAIRVMTVHGAKGLEAPIIVLADTTFVPEGRNDPWLLPVPAKTGDRPLLVWGLADKDDSSVLASARRRVRIAEEEEHRRLLYVALTRARDALIVCGCENARQAKSGLPEKSWYRLVRDALAPELEEISSAEYGFGGVWRWRHRGERRGAREAAAAKPQSALPAWLRTPLALDFMPTPRRSVSAPILPAAPGDTAQAGVDAKRRGAIIHRLLQELPKFPGGSRNSEAARFLAKTASDLAEETRNQIVASTLAVLDHPDFAPLFGPDSRGEVELFGRLRDASDDDKIRRIDRLVVKPDTILIADYKTDSRPPARPEAAPENYLAQLGRYRALLARALPGRAMRTFLVWTATPAIQEVPQRLLDESEKRARNVGVILP